MSLKIAEPELKFSRWTLKTTPLETSILSAQRLCKSRGGRGGLLLRDEVDVSVRGETLPFVTAVVFWRGLRANRGSVMVAGEEEGRSATSRLDGDGCSMSLVGRAVRLAESKINVK